MRTTKAELRHHIELLQRQGYDVAIHWAYGQPRITSKDHRDISPRLRSGEMANWLHGFDAGIEAEKERVAKPAPARPPQYQPKTGERCYCKPGIERDNCSRCEGTGWRIDFAAIRARK